MSLKLNPIRDLRRSKGLTQSALAKCIDKSRLTVVAWEVGRYRPDAESLPDLARVLGADPLTLTRDIEAFVRAKAEAADAASAA